MFVPFLSLLAYRNDLLNVIILLSECSKSRFALDVKFRMASESKCPMEDLGAIGSKLFKMGLKEIVCCDEQRIKPHKV